MKLKLKREARSAKRSIEGERQLTRGAKRALRAESNKTELTKHYQKASTRLDSIQLTLTRYPKSQASLTGQALQTLMMLLMDRFVPKNHIDSRQPVLHWRQ